MGKDNINQATCLATWASSTVVSVFWRSLTLMITPPSQRIGIVTSGAEKLADYFPTAAEPDFAPTELPFTPDDQLLLDELRRRGHRVAA